MTQLLKSPPAPGSGPPATFCSGLHAIRQTDAFRYLDDAPENAFHAVVTDPPYGLLEYTDGQLAKLRSGNGGVWRMPPALGGYRRRPVPRFTVLTNDDKERMRCFFDRLARSLFRVLTPGAHVFIAANPLVSYLVYEPFVGMGFEKRGEVIRAVTTLRGGDRPKNARDEFAGVTVMPRSAWEPWGLFRKPIEGRVQDNLRKWKTGALRRPSPESPFRDLIQSSPTPVRERASRRIRRLSPNALCGRSFTPPSRLEKA